MLKQTICPQIANLRLGAMPSTVYKCEPRLHKGHMTSTMLGARSMFPIQSVSSSMRTWRVRFGREFCAEESVARADQSHGRRLTMPSFRGFDRRLSMNGASPSALPVLGQMKLHTSRRRVRSPYPQSVFEMSFCERTSSLCILLCHCSICTIL